MISLPREKYQYTPEEKAYVRKCALYSFDTFLAFAPQVMQAKPFAWSLKPGLDAFYKDDPDKELSIMVEHADTFFNSHTVGFSLIGGIVLAMEKQRAEKGNVTSEAIQSIKASLMGPTAGIGDSIYFNCIRVIAAGISIGLVGDNGSLLGALMFILLFGGITLASKYYGFILGYEKGTALVDHIFKTGIVPLVSKAASILGLIMTGALVASNVKITIKAAPVIGGATIDFQAILDSIAPGILSLLLWYVVFKQLQKGTKPTTLIWVIMGACVLLAALGII